jgi:hypothetical protein
MYQQQPGQYVQYPQPGVAPVPAQAQNNPPVAPKKRKKKKNQAAGQGSANMANTAMVPQHVVQAASFAPQGPIADLVSSSSLGLAPATAPVVLPVDAGSSAVAALTRPQKAARCWKCAVNTHATKDCKVTHFCLVCDTDRHPTVRCPILKLPKPQGYFVGCGDFATLDVHLPDSIHKPHLIPTGAPTALVQVSGDAVTAGDIQSLMARMCPGHSDWKWEAVAHGLNAFLIGLPTVDDVSRIDGMQMGVPKHNAQATFSSWRRQDIAPEFVIEPVWVQVDGVPYTVRHFHGLWAVGSLIGSTMDVDLVTLRSRGIVRILVAMRDLSALEKDADGANPPCLEVVTLLKLNGYRFRYRREQPDFKPDPKFRPFFWKDNGSEDDSNDMNSDKNGGPSSGSAPEAANMDLDGPPAVHDHGKAAAPSSGVSLALTPYNNSPTTPRGKELVERARVHSPHLIAAASKSAPSRVRTFMQGRTHPEPVISEVIPMASTMEVAGVEVAAAPAVTAVLSSSLRASASPPFAGVAVEADAPGGMDSAALESPLASTSSSAMVVCALPCALPAGGSSVPIRPTTTSQPSRGAEDGPSSPAHWYAASSPTEVVSTPSRITSPTAPRRVDSPMGVTMDASAELVEGGSCSSASSPISVGIERSTSTKSLSVPPPSPPAHTCPSPSPPQPQIRVVRRSGRHAQAEDGSADTDEDMMQKAMRRKAEKNLDAAGNKKSASFIKFSDSQISSNLNSVGISLGRHASDIVVSANVLRHLEYERLTVIPKVSTTAEATLIEEDEDEADGHLLSSLVGSISEVDLEQPGLSSFYDLKVSRRNSKSSAEKKSRKGGKAQKSRKGLQ